MIHEFFVTLKNRHVEIALIVKKIDMALDKYEVIVFVNTMFCYLDED